MFYERYLKYLITGLLTITPIEAEAKEPPNYKPKLEVVETTTYNLDGTWGHTRPSERVIVMLPPERRNCYLPILDHEITHNAFPKLRNENYVTQIAQSPLMPYIRRMFDYSHRRA